MSDMEPVEPEYYEIVSLAVSFRQEYTFQLIQLMVDINADSTELKKAYRRQAMKV